MKFQQLTGPVLAKGSGGHGVLHLQPPGLAERGGRPSRTFRPERRRISSTQSRSRAKLAARAAISQGLQSRDQPVAIDRDVRNRPGYGRPLGQRVLVTKTVDDQRNVPRRAARLRQVPGRRQRLSAPACPYPLSSRARANASRKSRHTGLAASIIFLNNPNSVLYLILPIASGPLPVCDAN